MQINLVHNTTQLLEDILKCKVWVKTCIFQNPNPLNPINLSSLNTHARDSGLRIHLPSQLPIRLKLSNCLENSLQLTIKLLLNPYVWRRTIRDSVLETFPPLFKLLFGFDILKGVRDYFFFFFYLAFVKVIGLKGCDMGGSLEKKGVCFGKIKSSGTS